MPPFLKSERLNSQTPGADPVVRVGVITEDEQLGLRLHQIFSSRDALFYRFAEWDPSIVLPELWIVDLRFSMTQFWDEKNGIPITPETPLLLVLEDHFCSTPESLEQFLFWDILPWQAPDAIWKRRIWLFIRWIRCEELLASTIETLKSELTYWKREAFTDPLTGLLNPRAFRILLHREIDSPRQNDNACMALLMADLDHFKEVNDRWGHVEGDRILRQVAMRLSVLTPKEGSVARIGGDEFALTLPQISLEEAKELAEGMGRLFDTIPAPDGTPWHLSGCVGIALYPDHAIQPEELIQRADEALCMAKKQGKRQIRVYGWDDLV